MNTKDVIYAINRAHAERIAQRKPDLPIIAICPDDAIVSALDFEFPVSEIKEFRVRSLDMGGGKKCEIPKGQKLVQVTPRM